MAWVTLIVGLFAASRPISEEITPECLFCLWRFRQPLAFWFPSLPLCYHSLISCTVQDIRPAGIPCTVGDIYSAEFHALWKTFGSRNSLYCGRYWPCRNSLHG